MKFKVNPKSIVYAAIMSLVVAFALRIGGVKAANLWHDIMWPCADDGPCKAEANRREESKTRQHIQANPGDAQAHEYLSSMLIDWHSDWIGAVSEMSKAVELDPNNAAYHIELADALRGTQHFCAAIREIEKAIQLDPLNSDYRSLLEGVKQECSVERSKPL